MSAKKSDEISKTECDIENFKMVTEHFRQDLREYWNRANFYLVTNAGLFSAFLIVYPSLVSEHPLIVLIVPLLGITIAVLWFLVLRGALFWIKQWREQVKKLSKELDRFQCYFSVEIMMDERKLMSPSNLTKCVPIAFIILWIVTLAIVISEIL